MRNLNEEQAGKFHIDPGFPAENATSERIWVNVGEAFNVKDAKSAGRHRKPAGQFGQHKISSGFFSI